MCNDEGMTRLCVATAWQAKSERRKVVSDYFSLPQHAIDESRIARFNVGNGPIAKQLQHVCRDTLPWLISFSLGGITHALQIELFTKDNYARYHS